MPSVVLPSVRGAPRREVSVKLLLCICTWPSPRCWALSISEQSSSVLPSQSLSTPSQTLLSLVMASPTQVPSWQLSLLVQVSPSEQSPPLATGGNAQPVSASQVYVALSRCRSLQHIRVLGFDPAKVKAHPAALRFVEGLANSAPRAAEAAAG